MLTRLRALLAALLFTLFSSAASGKTKPYVPEENIQPRLTKPGEGGTLTYIYGEREVLKEGCQPAWGLVTLIDFDGRRILFDTGGDPNILKNNMQVLGIDPRTLDLVVISHQHWEMIGGVKYLLEANPELKVISTDIVVDELGRYDNWRQNFQKMDAAFKVTPNIILMKLQSPPRHGGPFGIQEIHIVLRTKEGLVILEGCGHPKIRNIMRQSQKYTQEKRVFLISGGTRLLEPGKVVKLPGGSLFRIPSHNYSPEYIEKLVDDLLAAGVQYIVPTHCTGKAEKVFAEKFGPRYINHKLGLVLRIPPPLVSPADAS